MCVCVSLPCGALIALYLADSEAIVRALLSVICDALVTLKVVEPLAPSLGWLPASSHEDKLDLQDRRFQWLAGLKSSKRDTLDRSAKQRSKRVALELSTNCAS